MSPRNVIHVIGNRWWSAISAYGIDLAAAQHARGTRVGVVTLRDTPPAEEARRRGLPVVDTFRAGPLGEAAMARRLSRVLAAGDVVHVHSGSGHAAAELARHGHPIALVRTRGDVRPPGSSPWSRWLYRRVDALALSGSFQRAFFEWMPRNRVHVVPAPVETDRFRPYAGDARAATRRSLGIPVDASLVGLIARLSPVKGHRVAVEALARMTTRAHLLVCGEPSQVTSPDIDRWAEEAGVADRVHVRGRVEDVPAVVAALDVGLVASTGSEAICRIAGEMMAAETPIVATRVSVLPDMIESGVTGLLVAPRDAAETAAALDELFASPGRRRELGANARRWVVEHASSEVVAAAYDALYDDVSAAGREDA